jgi:CRP/FNR family transcriptional regulator/CRP/FNR family cyclic AMP-dependent transcriptional regulator
MGNDRLTGMRPSTLEQNIDKKAELLKNVPLFDGLGDAEIHSLAEVAMVRHVPTDAIILLADEEGDTLFVIVHGRVKVTVMSEDGREVILSILKDGDIFGEMSLLDGKPRSASVIATDETELIMLRRSDFLDRLTRFPEMAIKMLATLASRLRRTNRQVESLALLNVYGRIAGTLLQLAEDQGTKSPQGVLTIPERPIHQEIANMAGTTRETVSRVLNDLERRGYLSRDGRSIVIQYPDRLRDDFFHIN